MIRSMDDADFQNKNVLVRVDLNVPLDKLGKINDDTRIVESLATIDIIIDKGGIPILMSHLGRPKGKVNPEFSLKPVADYLKDHFGYKVIFTENCIGESVKKLIDNADLGELVLLENLRFHKEEEDNDTEFAKQLADLGDVYVNDAFGTAHRAHASTSAIAEFFEEKYAGLLLLKELNYLGNAIKNPRKPFVAVIGGAKITGKIEVIRQLFTKCDSILIGGGMMFTFYKALGYEIGKSICEDDKLELAKSLLDEASSKNIKLMLPTDVVVADSFNNDAAFKTVAFDNLPSDSVGMDIGEKTVKEFCDIIMNASTVVWNGPMGVFEMSNFANGTNSIAHALAELTSKGGITVVGGGDSVAAISQLGLEKKITHVSTGGGASLEFLEGKVLPGVAALEV
ncbi:MAG: phosphoglycerate kinase [Desulfobulbaceae bacterium]|nr:phosphoglycerate kinase [Candidatus Kapabacteria bacterium]MBS3999881.1 phosphoglycerate kinase [Desulfobulbaceae bacterium]